MPNKPKRKRLLDAYRFEGFRPLGQLQGVFGDPKARVITLVRQSKKLLVAVAGECTRVGTIVPDAGRAICPVPAFASTWTSRFGAWPAAAAAR